jgi:MGT family glycosyltransferase
MARILCYTSPARGHLYPTVRVLLELQRRGHDLSLVTLADEVPTVSAIGLRARALAPEVEAIAVEDWRARSARGALELAVGTFAARALPEMRDLGAAIEAERPELLLIDFNCWGASALAERSGLPWALFMPYFLPWRLPGLPPFGPGLPPRSDLVGRLRDALARRLVHGLVNRHLPRLNAVRAEVALPPLADMADQGRAAPCLLYYTAEPFEYPCAARPPSVKAIGPGLWEPDGAAPPWLAAIDRPIVLVTCSTEFQDDGRLVATALEALADEPVFVVATTAAIDPATFRPPPNARVERFVPHRPLLARAACVVCHGGMGITQKALAAGVPVCAVPFGRDQLEVGRHLEVARAGVRLPAAKLDPRRLRAAVERTRLLRAGAERIAAAFRCAGGPAAGADALEALLATPATRTAADRAARTPPTPATLPA